WKDPCKPSVRFHGRALAVFDALLLGALSPQDGDAQSPDFVINRSEIGFGEIVWPDKVRLATRDIAERTLELFRREFLDVAKRFLDRRDSVANHCQVVPGANGAEDGFLETVFLQDGPHVEIVGHDQAFETELAT